MKALAIMAMLFAQESKPDLARDLSDDLIEVRERAHAALLKMGAPAYPILRRALESGDAEARDRALAILKTPAFLAVPEVVTANLRRLGAESREEWEPALAELLAAGEPALPLIRDAAKDRNPLLAFRAGQIAAILESPPVEGMRFGIFVVAPETAREGTVPGLDVLINASQRPIRMDFTLPSSVTAVPSEPVDRQTVSSTAVG